MKKDIYKAIAVVTGLFMLTVTFMLVVNYFQVREITPLQTEVMETLKSLNESHGENETLQLQIRQLDLLARKAYFVQEEHQKMGVYLLLAMAAVFIFCLRGYYADVKHIAPKEIDAVDEWLMQSKSRKYLHYITASLAVVALVALAASNPQWFESKKSMAEGEQIAENVAETESVVEESVPAQPVEQSESAEQATTESQPATESSAVVVENPTAEIAQNVESEKEPKPKTEDTPKVENKAVETAKVTESADKTVTPAEQNQPQTEATAQTQAPTATQQTATPAAEQAAMRVPHRMFRGRNANGHSSARGVPTAWDLAAGKSIAWREALTTKQGFSSPIVDNGKIFFTGGDTSSRELYCHDLATGKLLWTVKADGIAGSPATPPQVASNTGYASATPATDGKHVCAIFATGDIICADMEGKRLWAKNLGVPENQYGYVSSLLVWGSSVFVQYDNDNVHKIMALDIATGNLRWQKDRETKVCWSTPIIATVDGKAQLVLMGNPDVKAYNPSTGEQLWSVTGMAGEVCPSPCSAEGVIYAANEYAKLIAINGADGSILWEASDYLPEVASPVVAGGRVYIATSYGVLAAFDAKTGELKAEKELNVELYSSPMVVEGKIYLIGTDGQVFIFAANDELTQINSFATGEQTFATPAFIDGGVVIRTTDSVYCVKQS